MQLSFQSICRGTALLSVAALFAALTGCVSPRAGQSNTISPDSDPLRGGISSEDVRSVASKMAPAILSVPEISADGIPARIKVADFKNNSRFFIDRNLFMRRLRVELNRYGRNQVRFINDNTKVQTQRSAIHQDRQAAMLRANLQNLGREIANAPIFRNAKKPVKIAVIPILNANIVNMNADSLAAILRSEIVNNSAGKIQFLMPGETKGADYYLTGQFIAESLKKEGIINLANYIEVIDAKVKAGESMYINVNNANVAADGYGNVIGAATRAKESELLRILRDQRMRVNPNVNKLFNVMIARPTDKMVVYEKMAQVDSRFSDKSGNARFVLSGEISGMHQRRNGISADYIMVSVQLTDFESNEIVWEDAYEVKRVSKSGIVYR